MFLPDRIAFLNLGACHVAFGLLERRCSSARFTCLDREELRPPSGSESRIAADRWAEALRALRRRVAHAGPVLVIVPGPLLLVKHVDLPRVGARQRARILRLAADAGIPLAGDEIVRGAVAAGAVDGLDNQLVIAARRSEIEAVAGAVESAGFVPAAVVPAPLATLGLAEQLGPTDGVAGLASVGVRSTTLVVVIGERRFVRILPFGTEAAGRVAAQPRGAPATDPGGGCGSHAMQEACAPGVVRLAAQLADEIDRTLLHFGSSGATRPLSRFALAGGAPFAGLRQALAARLGIPVEDSHEPARAVESGADGNGGWADPDLAGAGLLAAQGRELEVDLLPPARRAKFRRRRQAPWLVAAALLALGALAPPLLRARAVARGAVDEARRLESALASVRPAAAELRSQIARLGELQAARTRWRQLEHRRLAWAGLLGELECRLGRVEGAWLERLELLPEEPFTGRPAGTRLRIVGRVRARSNGVDGPEDAGPDELRPLCAELGRSPWIAVVAGLGCEPAPPDTWRFRLVLNLAEGSPL